MHLLFWGAHVGLTHLLDKRGSKPYCHPQLLAVQLGDKNVGPEGVIQAFYRSTPANVQAVKKVTDAVGPQMREVHEVGDEGRAQLPSNEGACSVGKRLDCPADDVLDEALGFVLAQGGTIPVELDDEREGSIESDVVFAMPDQALGKLPSLGRSLQAMQHLLDLGDGLGRVWLVESPDQLRQALVFISHLF